MIFDIWKSMSNNKDKNNNKIVSWISALQEVKEKNQNYFFSSVLKAVFCTFNSKMKIKRKRSSIW